jgi:signal peptidase I
VSTQGVDPVDGVEPVHADGRHAVGSHADGRHADGSHADGSHADGSNGDGRSTAAEPEQERGALALFVAAVKEIVVVVAMALVLSFVVKTWLLQAFFIPSGSMEDTLLVGDRVVVSKLTPGPIDLEHGDVVVFEDPGGWLDSVPPVERAGVSGAVHDALVFVGLLPAESEDHLIKRVIGLPGDHVVCCGKDGRLTVNDVPITEPYLKPGDVPSSLPFDITVPADRVWVMGDHRSDSEDSRFHDPSGTGTEGSVPVSAITGRAVATVWPLDRAGWLSNHPETFSAVPSREPGS